MLMSGAATQKGRQRRQELVDAAAELLSTSGPSAVTMRAVAERVGCSLSATVYYFEDRNQLLAEAGRANISRWAGAAERVAEEAEMRGGFASSAELTDFLVRAMLARETPLFGHYLQLLAAGESAPVSRAYFTGRDRLNRAVARILAVAELPQSPELVIAVVDGAAVSALSEGQDVHATARALLTEEFSRSPIACKEPAGT